MLHNRILAVYGAWLFFSCDVTIKQILILFAASDASGGGDGGGGSGTF